MPDRAVLRAPDVCALLEAAPEGVFIADLDGRFIFVNPAGCRMLGMTLEEMLDTTMFDLISEGDVTRLAEAKRVMCEGSAHVDEWALRHQDGHWVSVEISANILPNGLWQSFVRDTTQRKQLEQRAYASERTLSSIFELLPVGVWITDQDGSIVRINEAASRIWGGARFVGKQGYSAYKCWWADTGKAIAADEFPLSKVHTTGESTLGAVVRIQSFDGTFKTLIMSAAPLRDAEGRILGAICVHEDITDIHNTQQKLQQSEALFRTVFELLPVGLYVTDVKGRLTLGNSEGHRIWTGFPHVGGPDDYSEYKAWWVDTGQPVGVEDWAVSRALRTGETSRSELIKIQCFDGSFKTVLNWGAPIRGNQGEIAGAIAVNQDVSVLVRTQEQLRESVREREHILSIVAHDLRNPLSSIATQAMLLQKKASAMPDGHACVKAAASILEASRQMGGLVDDLLAVSVAKSVGTMLEVAPVPAGELLASAAQQASPLVKNAGLGLEMTSGNDLPAVYADSDRIMRVFGNMLGNALKFTQPGGRIVLRAQPAPGAVQFSIANSGPEVSAGDRERMFQQFWQAAGQDARGAGLGLAICRSIIEAHGGSVWTEREDGMRLKIVFLLPTTRPHSAADPEPRTYQ